MNFEVGKEYKTKGGWKATFVYDSKSVSASLLFVHEEEGRRGKTALWHQFNGIYLDNESKFDIASPWVEPRIIEGWIATKGENGLARILCSHIYPTEDDAIRDYGGSAVKVRFELS